MLVVRPDGIGDVIMTGPFLRELKRACPQARITLVVAPHALNLVERSPYVDRVLTLRLPAANKWWRPLWRRLAALSFTRRYLWSERYDLAIVPRWGVDRFEASALAYLSAAPWRIGYSERVSPDKQKYNRGYDAFFTDVVDDRSAKHEVQRNLGLLSALRVDPSNERLEVWLSDEDEDLANEILGSSAGQSVVALGPGAGSPKRMWPIERFVAVGRWLTERGALLLVLGGRGEEALGGELRNRLGSRVIDVTGRTTIRQSAALLRRCSFYCGNDAGTMHLAAAVGVPAVEISCHPEGGDDLHPNSPTRFHPWGVAHRVVRPNERVDGCSAGCRLPTPHCILNVPVDSVIASIESLMQETSPAGWPLDAS